MKDLIRKILKEYKEEEKILVVPSLKYFGDDWNALQLFLKSKGNPKWKILDDLDLDNSSIKTLGNLQSVGGFLNLGNSSIKSLGNLQSVGGDLYLDGTPIESLGNLMSVGGYLELRNTPIESLGNLMSVGGYLDLKNSSIESLGNLQSVGGNLNLVNTPLSKKYTEEEIRQMVNVKGVIFI
jgi:hypothetical protein